MAPLPTFTWVIPNALASSAAPGSGGSVQGDLSFARDMGITHVLTIEVSPLDPQALAAVGLEARHLHIRDGWSATIAQVTQAVDYINDVLGGGGKVLVHCGAGLGRTGMILACYLVHQGRPAEEAIKEVRRITPLSIETPAQEQLIAEYERHLRQQGAD